MKRALLLVLALAGCDGSGVCAQRTGMGAMRLTARSGNCGPVPEAVVEAQPTAPTAPCTGTVSYSPDNCEMTLDQSCPAANGSTMKQKGVGTWDEAGYSGTGVFAFSVTNSAGAAVCYGTYDATFTKI